MAQNGPIETESDEEFTHSFLDTDTITVRNSRGIAVTFCISPAMSIAKYDRTLAYIKESGWTNIRLITYTRLPAGEGPRDMGPVADTKTDGPITEEDIRAFGITIQEYNRMYRYAQRRFIDAISRRFKK